MIKSIANRAQKSQYAMIVTLVFAYNRKLVIIKSMSRRFSSFLQQASECIQIYTRVSYLYVEKILFERDYYSSIYIPAVL